MDGRTSRPAGRDGWVRATTTFDGYGHMLKCYLHSSVEHCKGKFTFCVNKIRTPKPTWRAPDGEPLCLLFGAMHDPCPRLGAEQHYGTERRLRPYRPEGGPCRMRRLQGHRAPFIVLHVVIDNSLFGTALGLFQKAH